MREILGFVVLQGALAVTGLALLQAFGLVGRTSRTIVPALGAALLLGTAAVVLVLILLLVIGIPFTLLTAFLVALALAGAGFWLSRRGPDHQPDPGPASRSRLKALAVAGTGAYVIYGALAFARLASTEDDARIWSFKGVTLTYYDSLRGEIFLNPATVRSHHVYPLFQPLVEALMSRAMGTLELRLVHVELWILLVAAIWTAVYLVWWRQRRPLLEQSAIAVLALLITTPFIITSIATGYADITGSMLLGLGALALGLWLDGGDTGHLWLGAIFLATAANTKDEDFVGAVLVLLALGVAIAIRGDSGRLRLWLGGAAACLVMIAPWRIWTTAHGLSDSVQPPLPRALSPVFVLDRFQHLKLVTNAISNQVVTNWGWQAAIFLALCALALATGIGRRLAGFYLLSFGLLLASLVWLYTTTPMNLQFLITTSVYRVIDVFMMLTPFASAHVLTKLLSGGDPAGDALGSWRRVGTRAG